MILPGSTIGLLGSGQLGRMFAIAARQMGYRVHTYSPETDTPAGQVSDKEWTAAYDDLEKLTAFAKSVDVVTFEFENIPAESVEVVAKLVPVHPRANVLHVAQNRLREKTFLSEYGFPVAPFQRVRSKTELGMAVKKIGTPAVLKTAGFGYDGKGQVVIPHAAWGIQSINTLWEKMDSRLRHSGMTDTILEKFIRFDKEVSVVAARSAKGDFAHFGIMENEHVNHILDVTVSPARISAKTTKQAVELAREILKSLNVVGVMCVEMFLTNKEELIVNELAPRPHNSGHLTIDAFATSQFEQQLRAVCGLPLGSTEQLRPAAMVNLLGDHWKKGTPNWAKALSNPDVKLHLYGKAEPRVGRKMGHLTALGNTIEAARKAALSARKSLTV